ncbi:MAG: DUF89 family protein [Candidatus Riflebacteria bacterium]|nr:DUF89 family protein [Candidatus Riflebacteria bacterium]
MLIRDLPDCLVCLCRQAVEAGRFLDLTREVREGLIRQTLAHLAGRSWDVSPPEIAAETQEFMRRLSGNDDPYRAIKQASTEAALALWPRWEAKALSHPDPLAWALRLSAAGNLIDCGPTGSLDLAAIRQRMDFALRQPFGVVDLEPLRDLLAKAGRLLLLADNAGELVADRLLLEVIERARPGLPITVMVRGGPVLNDAIREDAVASGLPARWSIADSGARIPGFPPAAVSPGAREAFRQADVVIAKGQGNWETLGAVPHAGLFFLLTAKCPAVAAGLDVETGAAVLRLAGPGTGGRTADTGAAESEDPARRTGPSRALSDDPARSAEGPRPVVSKGGESTVEGSASRMSSPAIPSTGEDG